MYLFKFMAFCRYMPRSGIAGLYDGSSFSFLRDFHTVLHSGYTSLYFHEWCGGFPFCTGRRVILSNLIERWVVIATYTVFAGSQAWPWSPCIRPLTHWLNPCNYLWRQITIIYIFRRGQRGRGRQSNLPKTTQPISGAGICTHTTWVLACYHHAVLLGLRRQ